MKKRLPSIILIFILIAGLSLLLYPTASNWWNSKRQTYAIADYAEQVSNLSEDDYQAILNKAYEYNEKLLTNMHRYNPTAQELAEYNSILDVTGTGIIGYINIPTINVALPIYHGTSDDVLAIGVGHIIGSSLPVGGESTHSILSGHRGLPSAKLFTDLDKLSEGDTFIITVLEETMTYEVDQIRIVLPAETSDLTVKRGEDYCTLVTCTPYGINSHRMLVRGHRVENERDAAVVTSDALQIEPGVVAPVLAIPIFLGLFIGLMINSRRKKKRSKVKKKINNELDNKNVENIEKSENEDEKDKG